MCEPVPLVDLQSVTSSHRRSWWRTELRTYGGEDFSAMQEHLLGKQTHTSMVRLNSNIFAANVVCD